MKWPVMPKNPFICLFDHKSIVRHTLCAFLRRSFRLFWISDDFSCRSFEDKYFLLGIWNLGSSCSQRFRKWVLSTTDKGIRSPAMNSTSASINWICFGSFCEYFVFVLTKSLIGDWFASEELLCLSEIYKSLCSLWKKKNSCVKLMLYKKKLFACWVIFYAFLSQADFFSKISYRTTYSVNCLNPDQDQQSVDPDLCPNCLQSFAILIRFWKYVNWQDTKFVTAYPVIAKLANFQIDRTPYHFHIINVKSRTYLQMSQKVGCRICSSRYIRCTMLAFSLDISWRFWW